MNAKQRDSFETLDLADLHDATDHESGLRRLPAGPPPLPRRDAMRSLWREVVDGAPVEDPDPTYVSMLPPSPEPTLERVDLDALVDDLSKSSDALTAPRPAGLAAPLVRESAPRAPRLLMSAIAAAVIVAVYFGGVATSRLWEPSAPAPRLAPSPVIEEPSSREPSAIASAVDEAVPQREETQPARETLAPIVITPRIATSRPSAAPARTEDRVAPRGEVPSRAHVRAALSRMTPRVEACASDDDAGRVARVRLTFGSHGRAIHAVAAGVSGPTASCIAAVARTARVAPFARESFAVEYPFPL